jgi:hypothetical protein
MLRNHKTLQQELHLDQGLIFLRRSILPYKSKDRVLFSGEVDLTEMTQLQTG